MVSKHMLHYKLDQPIILIIQNKTDNFLPIYSSLYVFVNSRKDKGKVLNKHVLKSVVPGELDPRTAEVKGKHQRAIEGKKTIAYRDNQI